MNKYHISSDFAQLPRVLDTCNLFKNIFDFTTAGEWDCVAAVVRLPALHYSVDFISLSFGIMCFIVKL